MTQRRYMNAGLQPYATDSSGRESFSDEDAEFE
jgi:hypothetical protein